MWSAATSTTTPSGSFRPSLTITFRSEPSGFAENMRPPPRSRKNSRPAVRLIPDCALILQLQQLLLPNALWMQKVDSTSARVTGHSRNSAPRGDCRAIWGNTRINPAKASQIHANSEIERVVSVFDGTSSYFLCILREFAFLAALPRKDQGSEGYAATPSNR